MAKIVNHFAINSISELHRLMGLPKPLHPLISLINMGDVESSENRRTTFSASFLWRFPEKKCKW